jgi:hypothetical protein
MHMHPKLGTLELMKEAALLLVLILAIVVVELEVDSTFVSTLDCSPN